MLLELSLEQPWLLLLVCPILLVGGNASLFYIPSILPIIELVFEMLLWWMSHWALGNKLNYSFGPGLSLCVTVGGSLGYCVNLGEHSGQIDYHRCRAVIVFKLVVSYHDTILKPFSSAIAYCLL